MTSRMDRYENNKNSNSSRLTKNKELYEHLYTNSSYTEFTDINSSNVMDLTSNATNKEGRRENYQRQRKFTDSLGNNDESTFRYKEYSYHQIIEPNTKDYDINSVLEKARKNRGEVDELEKKRKLRTTEYNILADLTAEKLKEHKEKKKEVLTKEEEVELEELIHTITSNTMRQEIDNELLSNLMPTELDETIVSQDLSEMLLADDNEDTTIDSSSDIEKEMDDTESTLSKIDDSFYTKSMDLSDRDFVASYDSNDEIDNSFQEDGNKKSIIIKVIVVIFIIVLIAIIGTVLYNVLL